MNLVYSKQQDKELAQTGQETFVGSQLVSNAAITGE
jgi:hypothetical protein